MQNPARNEESRRSLVLSLFRYPQKKKKDEAMIKSEIAWIFADKVQYATGVAKTKRKLAERATFSSTSSLRILKRISAVVEVAKTLTSFKA